MKHVNHRHPEYQKPLPVIDALLLFLYGNAEDRPGEEGLRLLFCNHLVSYAELDAYPRRAQFIAAYSTGGSEDARRLEAMYLAEAKLLSAHEVADSYDMAADEVDPWTANGWTPEIH